MIPKTIHYCWLSGDKQPHQVLECMQTWREVLPDWELMLWDKKRFDISSIRYVSEACSKKKWAFAADYIRLYALYTQGGVYLDSDVMVRKPFDDFMGADFFTAVEFHPEHYAAGDTARFLYPDGRPLVPQTPKPGIGLQAAVLGSMAGHPFLADLLDRYGHRPFIQPDGRLDDAVIAPSVYAMAAEKYGFRYIDERQELRNNMLILPSPAIAGTVAQAAETSYAVHCCAGSWRAPPKLPFVPRLRQNFTKLFG